MSMTVLGSRIRRFEAACTTFVPVALATLILIYALSVLIPLDHFIKRQWLAQLCMLSFSLAIPIIFMVVDGAEKRATYGMRVRKLRFGDGRRGEITFLRCAGRILAGVALLPLLPLSWGSCIIDRQRRTLPDILCGTAVWDVELRTGFLVKG